MKRLVMLVGCFAAVAAEARSVRPGPLPGAVYADTEVATNVPFAFGPQGAKNFQFDLCFAATPSNNVQLAFGRDCDSDGALSADEVGMAQPPGDVIGLSDPFRASARGMTAGRSQGKKHPLTTRKELSQKVLSQQ